MNDIFLLSLTHHSAPVALRERLSLDAVGQTRLLDDVAGEFDECLGIVTCNRTEIYAISDRPDAPARVRDLLARHTGLEPGELRPHLRCSQGSAAAIHLFRVAAGLDSLVIGEPQILGQVRQAADFARQGDYSGPILERLFNYAIVTGKRARHETRISQGAGSISHAAVELARATLDDLQHRQCLVIGLGEMGQLVARNLISHGVTDLLLCNRSPERSAEVARELRGSDVDWDRLDDALAMADIGIVATGAREPILTRTRLERVAHLRSGRPLLLIDIAVPRNIDPEARTLAGIHLHDIDSLQSIREENLQSREQTIPQVEVIVEEELGNFHEWYRGRESAPVIKSLCQQAESIRELEVQRALRRLGHLDARDQEIIVALSHAITNKMLHEPVTRLKRSPTGAEHAEAVIDLFGLNDLEDEPTYQNGDD